MTVNAIVSLWLITIFLLLCAPVATSNFFFAHEELVYFSTQPEKKMQAYATLRGALRHFQSLRIFVLNECVNILNLLLNIALLKTINFSEHYFSLLSFFLSFFFFCSSAISGWQHTRATLQKVALTIISCSRNKKPKRMLCQPNQNCNERAVCVCRSKSKRPRKKKPTKKKIKPPNVVVEQ